MSTLVESQMAGYEIKTITGKYRNCKRCNSGYLVVNFLNHRLAGYCTWECQIGEPRGEPSSKSVAWKNKIPVPMAFRDITRV